MEVTGKLGSYLEDRHRIDKNPKGNRTKGLSEGDAGGKELRRKCGRAWKKGREHNSK